MNDNRASVRRPDALRAADVEAEPPARPTEHEEARRSSMKGTVSFSARLTPDRRNPAETVVEFDRRHRRCPPQQSPSERR